MFGRGEVGPPQGFLPDQPYFICATVRTEYLCRKTQGLRTSPPRVKKKSYAHRKHTAVMNTCVGLHANQPSFRFRSHSRFKDYYLDRQSGEVHRTGNSECKENDTHICFPPSINAARSASSISVSERRRKEGNEREGCVNIGAAMVGYIRK